MTFTHFPSAIVDAQNAYYSGLTGAYLILTSSSDYDATPSTTMASVINRETPQTNGYQRIAFSPPTAVWNTVKLRSEAAQVSITQTAAGGIIQFDRMALIKGASATASRSVLLIDATAHKLNFVLATPHGLLANDRVMVTADATGTVSPELPLQILYVVNPIDTTSERSIQLSLTSGGTAIAFSAGTLPIRVRYANGSLVGFETFSATTTVANGGTQPITLNLNWGTGTSDVNAV